MISTSEHESLLAAEAYAASGLATTAPLQRIASSLAAPGFPGAIFALDATGQNLCAAAPDWRQWQRLAPLLEACIGHTLSDFPSQAISTSAPERFTTLLGGFLPALRCRIRLSPSSDLRSLALRACEQLVQDVGTHVALIAPPVAVPGVGALLSMFESAMGSMDFERADQLLLRLRENNHLDAANVRFLRLRILAGQGEARRVETLQLAQQLHGLSVPAEVQQLLSKLGSDGK